MSMSRKLSDEPNDDAGPSEQRRKPSFEPKYTTFLSHSGAQTDFTEQLYEDLLRVHHFAFLDRCRDCLPKGEKFVPFIKEAAKQCLVAVLVLSEDYFIRTEWPMMELNEFVKAQESTNPALKILPLFFELKLDEFMEEDRRKEWRKEWTKFPIENGEVNLEEWKHALSKVPNINVLQYEGQGHVTFRKEVVDAICRLVLPAVKSDESGIQSREMLCKPISQKFQEVKPSRHGARVVGLYGMEGIGKTTISRVFRNNELHVFAGRACHVEFGGLNTSELRKKVLRDLTGASIRILEYATDDELAVLLKERMCREKVFLSLDSVSDDYIEEAWKYLDAEFLEGSLVLVTSRSLDVLVGGLDIPECDCLPMPGLDEEGGRGLFLYHLRGNNNFVDEDIINRCLKKCEYGIAEKGNALRYHPLALKDLGSYFRSKDVTIWEDTLKLLEDKYYKFGELKDNTKFVKLDEIDISHFRSLSILPKWLTSDNFKVGFIMDLPMEIKKRWNHKSLRSNWLSILERQLSDDEVVVFVGI